MERHYNIKGDARKALASKIAEITGAEKKYLGAPSMSYQIGNLILDREGTLFCEEAEDEFVSTLVWRLRQEGYTASEDDGTEISTAEEETPVEEEAAEETECPQEAKTGDTEETHTGFSFPLSQHRVDSIKNIIFTIYSKGELLSKSTGGDFYVSDKLAEEIRNTGYVNTETIINDLKASGKDDLRGIEFIDGKVSYNGFPGTEDPDTIQAWMKLCEAVNKACITQKRMLPKRNTETNEKFAFRTWLTRIGMNGPELKEERKIYYANLTGHTAFRTQADEDKWKARQDEKRAKLKAAKEQAQDITEESGVDDNE